MTQTIKYRHFITSGLLLLLIVALTAVEANACTAAIVGARRSATGHTLLWKHRDTGAKVNYVAHHAATDSTLEYIALHNDTDTLMSEAWIGMNSEGFAVMNTASYNLAPDTALIKDKEGLIMTMALQQCHTVADFGRLLDTLPRPMGVQANFGAIDAGGNAAWFETNDNGYSLYTVADTAVVVRTNYSHSGGPNRQLGLAREKTACHFLMPLERVDVHDMIDSLSQRYIDPDTFQPVAQSDKSRSGDYIPRPISTASIVIEAVPAQSDKQPGMQYKMWTVLGFPPDGDVECLTF